MTRTIPNAGLVLGYLILAYLCLSATDCTIRHVLAAGLAYDDFAIVRVQEKDTFESLAARYLNDPGRGWLISEFNRIDTLTPGAEVIVPLQPWNRGGIDPAGCQTVPVLVYHDLSKTKAHKTVVAAANFEAQMKYLKESGYQVISMDQLMDFLDFKDQLPRKSVVITLDKGWRSVYDIAFPILKAYGYPATLFVCTDFIGSPKALSWRQLQELADSGFDIQCNGKSQRNLTRLKKNESFKAYFKALEQELLLPKRLISQKLKKEPTFLAYPHGETNHLVIAVLEKLGYRAAFTLKPGSNPFFANKYRIRRSVIYGKYDLEAFKKNLLVVDQEVFQ